MLNRLLYSEISGGIMKAVTNGMMETPIYGVAEAAQYLGCHRILLLLA
jgi:hypothetical protein